jgi:hypothetical protein
MDDNGGNLKKCMSCRVALYCGRPCQKKQWKKHKEFCESLKINELKASDSSIDHPSWRNRDKLTKRKLRTSHADFGCKTPWPLTLETNAMLSLYFPCYLTAHPNMQFDFDGSYLTEIMAPNSELSTCQDACATPYSVRLSGRMHVRNIYFKPDAFRHRLV